MLKIQCNNRGNKDTKDKKINLDELKIYSLNTSRLIGLQGVQFGEVFSGQTSLGCFEAKNELLNLNL